MSFFDRCLQIRIFSCCKKFRKGKIIDNFVQEALRLILVGFLEIMISTYVGYSIFKLAGEMTMIDKITASVNVFYTICLIIYCVVAVYFVFFMSKPLIEYSNVKSRLNFKKIDKIIKEK